MLSAQGIVQGTPAFMAPEVVFGERRIDGRADLYSLACTAYWALTGQPRVRGEHAGADAPASCADHARAAVARSRSSRSHAQLDAILMSVPREGRREAARLGARARRRSWRACRCEAVDAGAGAGVVGDARAGHRLPHAGMNTRPVDSTRCPCRRLPRGVKSPVREVRDGRQMRASGLRVHRRQEQSVGEIL